MESPPCLPSGEPTPASTSSARAATSSWRSSGSGAVMLNGIYAAQAQKRQGPPGRAVSEANFFVSNIGEYFIYLIPVFGILLVLFERQGVEVQHHVRMDGARAVRARDGDLAQGDVPEPQEDQRAAARDGAVAAAGRRRAAASRGNPGVGKQLAPAAPRSTSSSCCS